MKKGSSATFAVAAAIVVVITATIVNLSVVGPVLGVVSVA